MSVPSLLRLAVLSAGVAAAAGACGRGDAPEGIARRFMDDYYVRVDLGAAKRIASGLALHKIDQELALTRGHAVGGATEGRSVAYHLVGRQQEGERHSFLYEVRIRLTRGGEFTRKAVLLVGRPEGAWRVTNFNETGL